MAGTRRAQLSPAIALGFASIVAAFIVAGSPSRSELQPIAVGLLTGLGAICLAFETTSSEELRERRHITIGFAFSLYYAVAFGISVLGNPPAVTQIVLLDGLVDVDLTALPLAYLCWFAGYRALGSRAIGNSVFSAFLTERSVASAPATVGLVYGSTVVVRVMLLGGGGFGYLRNAREATESVSSVGQYLSEFGSFGVVLLGVVLVAARGRDAGRAAIYRRMAYWMVPCELFFGLLVGQKSEFLFVVLTIGVIAIATHQIDVRRLAVGGVVALVFIFPFTETYRDIIRPPGTGTQIAASQAPAALFEALGQTAETITTSPLDYVDRAFDLTVGRVREIDRAAVSIQTHDAGRPYTPIAEVFSRAVQTAIPRVVWPDKPIDLYGLEVARDYYEFGPNAISATSLSPVGDAYRHGGLAAVALLMFLLGGLTRSLDLAFDQRRTLYALPLLLAALPLIRSGDLAGILTGAFRYFILLYPVWRLTVRLAPRVAGGAAPSVPIGSRAGRV